MSVAAQLGIDLIWPEITNSRWQTTRVTPDEAAAKIAEQKAAAVITEPKNLAEQCTHWCGNPFSIKMSEI